MELKNVKTSCRPFVCGCEHGSGLSEEIYSSFDSGLRASCVFVVGRGEAGKVRYNEQIQ
jgi:hypothetical protein